MEILGIMPPSQPKNVFAIQAQDLTDVMNAERYRGLQLEKYLQMEDTVGIVGSLLKKKYSPAKDSPEEQFDLIRIDDLPNQPWQVETVRTEKGKHITGTFFEVQENDILIARLGPTILNAKFILCPKQERRTIASAEFLVLRCNQRYQPEAVLWLLRTALYRKIMYLQSRGATPSRFRLDGDDLLNIPFPKMDASTQSIIATEVRRRHKEAYYLRSEAESGWQNAKRWFEEQLLGLSLIMTFEFLIAYHPTPDTNIQQILTDLLTEVLENNSNVFEEDAITDMIQFRHERSGGELTDDDGVTLHYVLIGFTLETIRRNRVH